MVVHMAVVSCSVKSHEWVQVSWYNTLHCYLLIPGSSYHNLLHSKDALCYGANNTVSTNLIRLAMSS
jgi:hypothetical protein